MARHGHLTYDAPLWRPPSEARSLILQATYGCSHNKCAFCHMYVTKKFRVRRETEFLAEVEEVAADVGRHVRRIFLADGDPLVMPARKMVKILETCFRLFPNLERISTYATPQNLLQKKVDDLKRIRDAGLSLLYFGLESGDDETLAAVSKGVDAEQMVEAARKAHQVGFTLSVTVLLGLAGPRRSVVHARATGEVLSRMDSRYASALTIMDPEPERIEMLGGRKRPGPRPWGDMDVWELLAELREMVASMNMSDCIFRSNHASNYLPLKGTLPSDKDRLLGMIDDVLKRRETGDVRPEWLRAL